LRARQIDILDVVGYTAAPAGVAWRVGDCGPRRCCHKTQGRASLSRILRVVTIRFRTTRTREFPRVCPLRLRGRGRGSVAWTTVRTCASRAGLSDPSYYPLSSATLQAWREERRRASSSCKFHGLIAAKTFAPGRESTDGPKRLYWCPVPPSIRR
jgi:hypothetical protein